MFKAILFESRNLIFQDNYIFFQGLADCVLALGFEKMEKGPLAVSVSLIFVLQVL